VTTSRRILLATALFTPAVARAATTRLRIGYQKNGALLILKQQRMLEPKLGDVSVEWFEFNAGPPILEAMNAGSIDFGATGDTPPIFAQAAGADLRYVAFQPVPGRNNAILVKRDGPIRDLADLKGRTIAVTKGSSAHNVVVQVLRKAGIDYHDVKPAFLAPADAAAAFRQGAVDAWAIWDPFYALAERDPATRVLTTAVGVAPSNSFFLAGSPILRARPDLVRAVIGETERISREIETHQEEFARAMAAATGIPEPIQRIAAARGNYQVGYITDLVVTQQQQIADTFRGLGLIPAPIRVRDAVWLPTS